MAMTQNPQQNPDATVEAANQRQLERNERRGNLTKHYLIFKGLL